ncbi:MAG: hypothetical protein ACI4P6_05630 [Candidatus Spyradosoma sp.]
MGKAMNFCGIHFHAGTPVSSGFFASARAARDAEKSVPAAGDARILVFDGETPPTTDVLLLLSRQCNYAECPNVCVEGGEYFYAWREGDFRHGTLVDRKNLSVRTWSFRDGTCVLYW